MADVDVETSAAEPKSVTVDGRTTTVPSITEKVLAGDRATSNAAVASKKRGLHLTRLKPGGTVV